MSLGWYPNHSLLSAVLTGFLSGRAVVNPTSVGQAILATGRLDTQGQHKERGEESSRDHAHLSFWPCFSGWQGGG